MTPRPTAGLTVTPREVCQIWSERTIPAAMLPMLAGRATLVGTAESTPDDPLALVSRCTAIIASSRIRYDDLVMDLAPDLQVISRTGSGVDNIDISAATKRGIVVCNTPDGPTISTAEHAIALLLATTKCLKAAEAGLRSGRFDLFSEHGAIELDGRVLGIVGFGAIGSMVARFASALGMQVLAFDPYVRDDVLVAAGVLRSATLVSLLGAADVVSLHVPLTGETSKMIDARAIRAMRPNSFLINTARGGVVDEQAVIDALDTGHLAGVGLDVFDPEPPLPTNPLLHRADVIATPHVAAATTASRERLWRTALTQALQVVAGEWPDHVVNSDVRWPGAAASPSHSGAESRGS